ncbi:MAG: UDP-N-acetylmuramate dehydrogenase [Pseudomonadota bacterium]
MAYAMALIDRLPLLRGRIAAGRALADLTWLRVGGPAELLFQPADAEDLAVFLAGCPADIPVTPIGVGSNLLVRDGGVPGIVIRLGRGFSAIAARGTEITAGAAALDAKIATAAAEAGIAGLEFLRGVPGSLGGALAMNAGCYGRQLADVLVEARGLRRDGTPVRIAAAEMGFSYRQAAAADGVIFTEAVLGGTADAPEAVSARMAQLLAAREATQPVRARTGGSTFRNPSGRSSAGRAEAEEGLRAWQVIDAAGCRGLRRGGAQISEKHCNFLINTGDATAEDLETLAETVRARVKAQSGHDLVWEIQRIGVKLKT